MVHAETCIYYTWIMAGEHTSKNKQTPVKIPAADQGGPDGGLNRGDGVRGVRPAQHHHHPQVTHRAAD
jgi:hypothetical protein